MPADSNWKSPVVSFQLTGADLRGQSRNKKTAMARQIAMYLMRNLTNLPLKEIGEEFGGRNHATVLSSIRKVEELLKSFPYCVGQCRAESFRNHIHIDPRICAAHRSFFQICSGTVLQNLSDGSIVCDKHTLKSHNIPQLSAAASFLQDALKIPEYFYPNPDCHSE